MPKTVLNVNSTVCFLVQKIQTFEIKFLITDADLDSAKQFIIIG
jgi:hypothetical protein